MSQNLRAHFRLEYPSSERPTLDIKGDKYEVLDLSEKGAKVACRGKFKPQIDSPIKGTIKFRDGKECPIAGKVLRINPEADWCVLQLTLGVPLAKMMEEQLIIIRKYRK